MATSKIDTNKQQSQMLVEALDTHINGLNRRIAAEKDTTIRDILNEKLQRFKTLQNHIATQPLNFEGNPS